MPCYSMQTYETTLVEVKDLELLKSALQEMGLQVEINGNRIVYSGRNEATGEYYSGSYQNGALVQSDSYSKIQVPLLKKYMGVANLKKNAAKYKWTLKPVKGNPFAFDVQK